LEGLLAEDVGIFCGHFTYFTAIGYILWPFGIFDGHLVYFPLCTKKNLATLLNCKLNSKICRSATGLPDGIFPNQKIPIWVNFGGPCNGIFWYILWPFGQFPRRLAYFMEYFVVIWCVFPVLVFCTKKNLARHVCDAFITQLSGC
jgi:hypothetical protein